MQARGACSEQAALHLLQAYGVAKRTSSSCLCSSAAGSA